MHKTIALGLRKGTSYLADTFLFTAWINLYFLAIESFNKVHPQQEYPQPSTLEEYQQLIFIAMMVRKFLNSLVSTVGEIEEEIFSIEGEKIRPDLVVTLKSGERLKADWKTGNIHPEEIEKMKNK